MAPHSSTLAWKIQWTEEPARLQSMGSRRVGHDWATSLSLFTFMHWRRKWQPTPVFFPGESQGQGSLVGCHLWGRTESDTTEATWQQQQQEVFKVRLRYYVASTKLYTGTRLSGEQTPWTLKHALHAYSRRPKGTSTHELHLSSLPCMTRYRLESKK